MLPFTPKELYMMNGGNKLYIYKDGFGDVYTATAEEEAAWREELIQNYLQRLDTEINAVSLTTYIETLHFLKTPDLQHVLVEKLIHASPDRKIVFSTSLRKLYPIL